MSQQSEPPRVVGITRLCSATSIDGADGLPALAYVDPDVARLEIELIFARTWQPVGHVSALRAPGDYFTTTLFGEPLIVSLDSECRPRAWFNVCAHRGAPVAEGAGCVKAFRCRYHSWTYSIDGRLVRTPGASGAATLPSVENGLSAVELAVSCGLLFCRLVPGGPSLDRYLNPAPERIRHIDVAAMALVQTESYTVKCNWKLYAENLLDGYHFGTVHPTLNVDERNYRVDCFDYCSEHHISMVGDPPSLEKAHRFWIFPNLRLNVFPHMLVVNSFVPVDAETTKVVFSTYADLTSEPRLRERISRDQVVDRAIQAEDNMICEQVQRGVGSRGYRRASYFARWDHAIQHFHKLYLQFRDSPTC